MTKKELDNHFRLLESLRQAREMKSHFLKKAEQEKDNALLFPILQDSLADSERTIAKYETMLQATTPSIKSFIDSVDNLRARQLLRLRYLQGLPWCEVSYYTDSSETACKALCYNYFKKHGIS